MLKRSKLNLGDLAGSEKIDKDEDILLLKLAKMTVD